MSAYFVSYKSKISSDYSDYHFSREADLAIPLARTDLIATWSPVTTRSVLSIPNFSLCSSIPIRDSIFATPVPNLHSIFAPGMSSFGLPFPVTFGGGAAAPSAQDFDCFVVVDFEATCEKDVRIYPQEIIEFPAVLVDGATGRLASVFRRYVRPQHHPLLTQFCRDLTGIRQEDVDGGVDLAEALRLLDAWLERTATLAKKRGRFAVVTWGDWDCRTMLESECHFKGVIKPSYFDRWINLRVPFLEEFGGTVRITLQEAVRAAGLEWEGRLHCGMDDALNTARLLVELMRRGVHLAITGSLPPQQLQQVLPPRPPVHLCVGSMAASCCFCGVVARKGVVVMPGPMQGRCFYGCGNLTPAMQPMCPFFMWADC